MYAEKSQLKKSGSPHAPQQIEREKTDRHASDKPTCTQSFRLELSTEYEVAASPFYPPPEMAKAMRAAMRRAMKAKKAVAAAPMRRAMKAKKAVAAAPMRRAMKAK